MNLHTSSPVVEKITNDATEDTKETALPLDAAQQGLNRGGSGVARGIIPTAQDVV